MLTTENAESTSEGLAIRERFDPTLQHVEMPFSAMFYPLGFPVRVNTNCQEILEAAAESWGAFQQVLHLPPFTMTLGVLEDGATECPPAPISRARGDVILRVADAANFYMVDLLQGFLFGWLNAAAVSHRAYLRYHILEAAVLSHIANRYAAPIHAACLTRQGRGVLLCGDSGAGKSSLAFACARAGWTYVTDDASFLLLNEEGRQVVGNCHMVRLRPSAAELFDEVAGRPITPRAAGKPSIELPLAAMPEIRRSSKADVDYVVFLDRKNSHVQELVTFPRAAAWARMTRHLCGTDELCKAQEASLERLLTVPIFELHYRDLDWAVERLERLVGEEE